VVDDDVVDPCHEDDELDPDEPEDDKETMFATRAQ